MSGVTSAKSGGDGSFAFRNIPPGDYYLSVRVPGTPERVAEAAKVQVQSAGADVEGLTITTLAGGAFKGRVVVEGGAAFPKPLNSLTVRPLPVDRDTATSNFTPDNGRVQNDGTFELHFVNGENRLTLGTLPDGWAI
jgi:hypothetical protein